MINSVNIFRYLPSKKIFKQNGVVSSLSPSSSISPLKASKNDCFISLGKNFNSQISFRGAPYFLDGVPKDEEEISAQKAIELYDKLRLGNYLDHGGDTKNPAYVLVKKNNLKFLDNIKSEEEKKKFIKYYCFVTGFPDLTKVCKGIEDEFIRSSIKSVKQLQDANPQRSEQYKILDIGYDGVCSVAHNVALPGSDIDKAYVLLRGSDNLYRDAQIVSDFKGKLWNNTDQRILSYNHDLQSFPKVITWEQAESLSHYMDIMSCQMLKIGKSGHTSDENLRLRYNSTLEDSLIGPIEDNKYHKYLDLTKEYHEDYRIANAFLVDLLKHLPKRGKWANDVPTDGKFYREDFYNFAFVLEAMLYGKTIYTPPHGNSPDYYVSSTLRFKKCINTSQIRALKDSFHIKPKHKARLEVLNNFDAYTTDEQMEIIKDLIYGSCAMIGERNSKHTDLFTSNVDEKFNELMKAVDLN